MPDALVERDGHTMVITMNRPQRYNALTGAMLVRMYDAMVEACADDDIRCDHPHRRRGQLLLGRRPARRWRATPRTPTPRSTSPPAWPTTPTCPTRACSRHYRPTKPIIAAVEGVAIAGGTEILQGTDIRVAGESARFGVSEARWSLYPMGGSAVRLRRQIPYTHAAEILLTGKHITAEEAAHIGLIGHVVPDGQALAKALEIAATITDNGPLAVEAILRTLRETDGMTEQEALAHEFEYGQAVVRVDDAKEGPKAFAEKRTPNFQRK